jgi:hypothetical protein
VILARIVIGVRVSPLVDAEQLLLAARVISRGTIQNRHATGLDGAGIEVGGATWADVNVGSASHDQDEARMSPMGEARKNHAEPSGRPVQFERARFASRASKIESLMLSRTLCGNSGGHSLISRQQDVIDLQRGCFSSCAEFPDSFIGNSRSYL